MADEIIGGIGVTITGDYSGLVADFMEAENLAKNAGQQIAGAFQSAATGATSLSDALQELANSAAPSLDDQFRSLYANGLTLNQALQQIQAQNQGAAAAVQQNQQALMAYGATLTPVTQQVQQVAQVAQQAAGNFQNLGAALQAFGNTAVGANTSSNNLVTSLLQLGGIVLTLRGIRDAAEEAFTAFAQLQRATESLTVLTGSAETANTEIAKLRDLAQTDALSFPSLLKADQNMRAFGISGAQIPALLDAAANAAIATGRGFDQTAQALERMIASGMVGGRQLASLGVTTKDLADTMGTTTDQVSKMFRALNESARTEIAQESLKRFADLAKSTSNDLTGSWQKLANVANQEFASIGASMEPAAASFIRSAADIIRDASSIVQNITSIGTVFKDLGPQVANGLAAVAVAVAANPFAALGLSMIQAGLAWREMTDAQDKAKKSIEDAAQSFSVFQGKATQLFSLYPDFKGRIEDLNGQLRAGFIDQDEYRVKVEQLRDELTATYKIVDQNTQSQKSYLEKVNELKQKLAEHKITLAEYNDELSKLVRANSDAADSTKKHVFSLEELEVQTKNGTAEIDKAMAVLRAAQALDDGSTRSKVLEAEALKQLEQAQKKYSDTVVDANVVQAVNVEKLHQSLDGLVSLYNALQQTKQGYGDIALETDQATQKFEAARNSLGLLDSDVFRLMVDIPPLGPLFKQVGVTAAESFDETAAKFNTAYTEIAKELGQFSGDAISVWVKYTDETKKAADAHSAVQTAAHAMGITTVADLTAMRDKFKVLIADMQASGEASFGAIAEAERKVRDLQDQITAGMNPLTQAYKDLNLVSIAQLQVELARKQAAADALSGTQDYARALEVVQKAQNTLNQALNVGVTNEKYIGDTGADTFGSKIPHAIDDGAVPAVGRLNSALSGTKTQMDALAQGIADLQKRWNDFAAQVASPQTGAGIAGGIGNLVNPPMTLGNLENPYWGKTPAEIQAQFNDLMNSFGGSVWSSPGVRALYAAQYALEQAALMNYYETNPTTSKQLGTVGKSTSTTPAGVPTGASTTTTTAAPVSPFDVLGLGPNLVQVITDNTQALTNQAAPALASLTTAVTTLTPAVTTATTQITAANQVSAAAFQALAAPITAPTAATAGPLAAFTRPGTPSPLGTFNINVNAQSSDAQVIAQAVTTEINRLGVRFQ